MRLMEKVDKTTSCWNWTASLDRFGYGQFRYGKTMARAHRISYFIHKKELPSNIFLDHTCRNKKCVNPDHLEPVTNYENLKRGNHNMNKQVCKRGHPIDIGNPNTYIQPSNKQRSCRMCNKERKQKYREVKAY